MKLLLVLVSAIAIFTADSRDFPDKPDRSDTFDNDDQPPWLDGQTTANQDEYFTDEPEFHDSTDFTADEKEPMDGSMQFAKEPEFVITSELDQQLTKEGNLRIDGKLRGSSCSSSVICSILGGSCISKAIHCSGWLVAEGCNGTNCKCCIPGSLEIKTNEIGVDLQAIKNALATSSLQLESDMKNITNADSQLRKELQNITIANSELKSELESMKSNISRANSELKMEIRSLKSNVSNSNLDSKLDNVIDQMKQGCNSKGLFWFYPTSQCFKYMKDKGRSWSQADAQCRTDGLQLAKPVDPVALTKHFYNVIGLNGYHFWIGAQGTGSQFRWKRNNQYISNSDSKWISGRPGSSYSTSYCLNLYVLSSTASSGKVYHNYACSYTGMYALCELVM